MDITDITDAIAEAEQATVNAATALTDVQVDLVIARQHIRALRQLAAGADRRVEAWVDDAETTQSDLGSDLAHVYLEMARLAMHHKASADRLTRVLENWIALRRGPAWTTDRGGSKLSSRNSSRGTAGSTS
jgi:hypothetical protein